MLADIFKHAPKRPRFQRSPQEMPDFYRFQQREKRREEIIDHRKRNERDMDTVKQMKKAQMRSVQKPGFLI